MINSKYFLKGYKSIKGIDSPAFALGCSFIAIGALLKNLGFNIQESIWCISNKHFYSCLVS